MKYYMSFLIFLCAACSSISSEKPTYEQQNGGYERGVFTSHGHNYIEFWKSGTGGTHIVHDPDCPCKAAVKLDQWMSQ